VATSNDLTSKGISLRIHELWIGDGHPVRIMGVLNVSPESFYPGSVSTPRTLARRARDMIDAGASMLDLGGRSTAPRAPAISVEEELDRVGSALEALLTECDIGGTVLSVDTQYRVVAERAFDLLRAAGKGGRLAVNDVSCLRADPSLAEWIAAVGCPAILMAAHERPGDSLGVPQTIDDLRRGLDTLDRLGVEVQRRVIVDPAIGRWTKEKGARYDCELIRDLEAFRALGCPILVGISRKSFIGEILGEPDPANRLAGTQAATAVAVSRGAHVVRTHDVSRETLQVARVARSIRLGTPEPTGPKEG
jgi:dihydropteroate synthase